MEQQELAALGPQHSAGLWELFQQQQQQHGAQHGAISAAPGGPASSTPSPSSSPQAFTNCMAGVQPSSLLHQGVLSGKPLSSVPGPAKFQVAFGNGSSTAAQMHSVQQQQQQQHQCFHPGFAALGSYPGGQLPQQHAQQQSALLPQLSGLSASQSSGAGAPPIGATPGVGALGPPAPVPQLPLSGAALAAAAHLRPPPLMAAMLPASPFSCPSGTAPTVLSKGMAGLQLNLAPSSMAPTITLGGRGQDAQGGVPSPPAIPSNLTVPMATLSRVKSEPLDDVLPTSSQSHTPPLGGGLMGEVEGSPGGSAGGSGGLLNKSHYRGVSYDRKKGKWRVQIKVAALGKSGVSVGYFDTEEAAARAYDRAAIGLLGRDNPNLQTNFNTDDYAGEAIPRLSGKSREEVKTTLKSERIKQAPRRRFTTRQRTSRFMGVGSSNRKNQWQARILVHGKVTHLGYYETEEEAARVYDRVSLALHGEHAQTNFPAKEYSAADLAQFRGLEREDLQRALGVKPMDKSSRFRGVSKKKGKWEAKVMVNRRWAYRELFDSEEEAARAYDRALWRLKPKEARSYVNFKDHVPQEVAEMLAREGEVMHGGVIVGSSEEDASGHSEEEGESDEEDIVEGQSAELAAFGHVAGGAAASGRPRRAAAAAAQLHRVRGRPTMAPASMPARASQRQAAAMVGGAPPQPCPSGWYLQTQGSGTLPPLGALRPSGSAPNLAALGAGAFGASPPAPAGSYLTQAGALRLGGFQGASLSRAAELAANAGGSGATSAPMIPTAAGGQPTLPFGQPPPAPQVPLPAQQQPLLVRVGSESHLISHQPQYQHRPSQQVLSGGGGSKLGKRMSRIQSEPHFPTMLDSGGGSGDLLAAGAGSVAEVEGLLADRDLFNSIGVEAFSGIHDDDEVGNAMSLDTTLDTDGILDFIKDLPDINPVSAAAGGMFKSRSAVNLSALGSLWDEEDAALASLEFSRPKKMSRSMSATHLAHAAGTAGPPVPQPHRASPPRSSPSHSSDSGGTLGVERLGPLGKPIRRSSTFTASLAPLEEREERLQPAAGGGMEGGGAGGGDAAMGGLTAQHHFHSGDDLVQQLLGADSSSMQQQQAAMDDALQVFQEFAAAS